VTFATSSSHEWDSYANLAMVIMGMISGLVAIFGKKFYNSDEFGNGDTPSSRWSGKMMFGTVGVFFIAFGFYRLFFGD